MDALIIDPRELRETGFRALSGAIGWVNAVRSDTQPLRPGKRKFLSIRGSPSCQPLETSRRAQHTKHSPDPLFTATSSSPSAPRSSGRS